MDRPSNRFSGLNLDLLRACLVVAGTLVQAGGALASEMPSADGDAPPSLPGGGPSRWDAPEQHAACACRRGVDWTTIPPVDPLPRLGMAVLYPTGPGYYSLADQLHGDYTEKAPSLPWGIFAFTPGSAFDLDYRYLDKPDNRQCDCFDPLKRIHLGDDWLLSVGGQTWLRTMKEVDSRLTTANNEYELLRSRLYADVWYQDLIRVFAELIYAESFNSDLNPLPIDINRGDLLNLFADVKLAELDGGPVYVRAGRQELLYGSQRLISPLEWANTRRTFEGVKAFYEGEDWDLDLFWVQPVLVDRDEFDKTDNNQNLFGAWASRRIRPGTGVEFYYLYLDNTNPVAAGRGGAIGGEQVHTLGWRSYGDYNNWLYDVELMFQLGSFSNQDLVAASTPVGLGYHFKDQAWTPQVWLYYDWASGDTNPGAGGTNTTFNPIFPFGHYYFGYLDLVGRQNIQDVYTQFVFFPENWLTCLVQYHNFWLASTRDALYNAAGVPLRQDPTGRSGRFVGHEIDLLLSAQVTDHTNFAVGWSKLFSGGFIERTGPDVSPELLYMQVNYRW